MSEYRYTLYSVDGNSHDYGNCDVCGKHCTEVFNQQEEQAYKQDENGVTHYTQHKCTSLWGHKECLVSQQR